jgi:hypothetical protein
MKTKSVLYSVILICAIAITASCLVSCGEPAQKAFFQGRVLEASTGMPLSNVTVYLNDFPYETASDAQFIFSELEPGKVYTVKVSSPYYEDVSKEVIAAYPSTTEDIKMNLKKTSQASIPKVKNPDVSKLRSFDFDIQFGLSSKEVTIMETGTFVAPESYSYEMKTKKRDETPAMPGSADANVQDEKPKFNTAKSIEIGNRQWADMGDGWKLNDRFHPGFRDIFGAINLSIGNINKSIAKPMFVSDEGVITIYGHQAKRIKGVTIIDATTDTGTADKVFIEFSAAIIDEGDLTGVPVEIEVSSYRSIMQVKNWTRIVLSNFNTSVTINPPLK